MFFPESRGDDYNLLYYMGFRGEATNFKREAVVTVYESKPQVADHKNPDEAFGSSNII